MPRADGTERAGLHIGEAPVSIVNPKELIYARDQNEDH